MLGGKLLIYTILFFGLIFSASAYLGNITFYYELESDFNDTGNETRFQNMNKGNVPTTFVPGKIGNAVDFERDNSEYARNETNLDVTAMVNSITWCSFMIKPETMPGANMNTMTWGGGDTLLVLLEADNTFKIVQYDGADAWTLDSTSTINGGKWWHIVWNMSTSAGKLWINGSLEDTCGNSQISSTTSTFNIGVHTDLVQNFYDGLMDNFACGDGELTTDDVTNIYNGGAGVDFLTYGQPTDELNLSVFSPDNNNKYITNLLEINFTYNSSFPLNCTLYVNDTSNQSKNLSPAGQNQFLSFNLSFNNNAEAYLNYSLQCFNNQSAENSSTYNFDIYNALFNFTSISPINESDINFSSISVNSSMNISDIINVTLYINGTINNSFIYGTGQDVLANFTANYPDGHYQVYFEYLFKTVKVISDIVTIFIDTLNPTIQYYNPLNYNISNQNLTTNITVFHTNLHSVNFTVSYSNGDGFYSLNYSSTDIDTNNISINTILNFTKEDNYSVKTQAYDNNGNVNVTEYFYYDLYAPVVIISNPTSTETSKSLNVITNVTDNKTTSCIYWVTDINKNPEVAVASYDCISSPFVVTSTGSYIVFVNATDGLFVTEKNATFTVDESTGTSGGGSSSDDTKKLCKIEVRPTTISLSLTKTLAEVKIKNNEDFSYNPTYSIIEDNDKNSFKDDLQITNVPGVILQGTEESVGIKYLSDSEEEGDNIFRLSSSECKDININIKINQVGLSDTFEQIFDPSKPFSENIVDLMLSPFIDWQPLKWLKVWMVNLLILVGVVAITLKKISKNNQRNKKGIVTAFIIFDIMVSFFLTLASHIIINIGG